jgi:outer membrane protein assembly factor BamB
MTRIVLFILLLLCGNSVFAQQFRFAFFTDTHVTKGGTAAEDLQRAVDQTNRTDSIDFVIVAGDLTEEGDGASLRKAKGILDGLKAPYHAILGNHETKWSESGVTDFGQIFGAERFRFEHKGFLFLGFNTGPLMRMADGHVAPQDISWLKTELAQAGKQQPVIIITHYPLTPEDVDNWYEVTDAIRPYNIKAVLGGHFHTNRTFRYDGIPGILNRSMLRASQPVGGYTIYDITPDSILVSEQLIGQPKRQWTALSLHTKYYEPVGDPHKYPDLSVNNEYPQVVEQWIHHSGVGIYSSPVYLKNQLYVGDDLGVLTCYRADNGEKRWSFQSGNRIVGTPDAADGTIVFGSADGFIYGLNSQSGRLRWKVKAGAPVLGAVTICDGVAYIGASDSCFRAINIRTGKVIWSYAGVRGYIETKPLITANKVIFGAWDNTLYALEKSSGKELWRWTGGLTRMHFSPAAVWPVAADGKVFITDPERAMTAINIETGATVWRTKQSVVRETIGRSEDGQQLYSKTMNDSIVCFATSGSTPRQLWTSNVGFGYEHAPSMPVERAGVVFGSTKNGLIFALEAATGRLLWKHKIGNSLISTVVPLSSRQLFFTATGGEVGVLIINNE